MSTWQLNRSLLKKRYNSDISSDDNNILKLEKSALKVTPTQIINKDNECIQSPPMQFSIEIEVEECDPDITVRNNPFNTDLDTNSRIQEVQHAKVTDVHGKYAEQLSSDNEEKVFFIRKIFPLEKRKERGRTIVKEYSITTGTIMKAIEEQSKENTEESDKCLDIFCRNLYGQFRIITLSFYDEEINRVMKFWSQWCIILPMIRGTPLMYKCHICQKGWWRLQPFKEHLNQHSNLDLKLRTEPIHHELNIIAYTDQENRIEDVEVASNCWKCGRDATFHQHSNPSTKYQCSGCNKCMVTCTRLKKHESMCVKNIILNCKKYKVNAGEGLTCIVCSMYCLNERFLDAHMIDYHLVRSDEPAILETKKCKQCGGRYFIHIFHDCPSKERSYECDICYKSFTLRILYQIHIEFSKCHLVKCNVCGDSLPQCMVPGHYWKHSKNYCLLYMCSKCDTDLVFTSEEICINHTKTHNNRDASRRMLLPKKCLNGEVVKSEKTFSIPDVNLQNFLSGLDDNEYSPIEDKVESAEESDLNSGKLGDKDFDINAMQAQLDEEIMRDLEVEATISKVFQMSKSYRLMMEKEELEIKSKENKFRKKDSKTKESVNNELLEKGSTKKEVMPEESINNELTEMVENEEIFEDDLIILDHDEVVTTISDSESEETIENRTDSKMEFEELEFIDDITLDSDTNKGTDLKPKDIAMECSQNDSKQDLDLDTSVIVKVEAVNNDNTIELEPAVFAKISDSTSFIFDQEKVKLEPSEDLTQEVCEDMVQIIASKQNRIETNDEYVNIKSENGTYECNVCDYKGEWNQYIIHVSIECPGTVFSCNSCDNSARFRNLRLYLKHLTMHGHKPLSCPECSIQKKTPDELYIHVISHIWALFSNAKSSKSEEMSLYYCKECGKCVRFDHFFKHWQMHVIGQCYTDEDYASPSSSDQDEATTMSSELIKESLSLLLKNTKRFKVKTCNVCLKKFTRCNECKRHIIEHLLVEAVNVRRRTKSKVLKCYFCDKEFVMLYDWKFHMREHSHLQVYRCELCGKCFSDSSNFCKHKKVHNLFTYICDLCGGKYSMKRSLIQHLKLHENTLSCENCDMKFVNESKLRRHTILKHNLNNTRRRPFHCHSCVKKFKTWREKQQHMWIKHGQRKVTADCPLCDWRFRTGNELKRHLKLKHKSTFKEPVVNELNDRSIGILRKRNL